VVAALELNENTGITIPIRNLVAMIVFTCVSTMAYFGIQERLNLLEHALDKTQMDITQNSEFRIKWPRGELGSLPADARQDMLLEYISDQQQKQNSSSEKLKDSLTDLKLRIAALEAGVEINID
tara:strand:- start:2046 stop:2417 length:372 start_codon:yes stop_codon:yes gene_type:complete